ncbi:MAG: hypothetical protein ABIF40_05255 [archaeon]
MDRLKLKQELEKIRRRQEFFKDFTLEETTNGTSASIDMQNHDLSLSYNPEWLELNGDEQTSSYLGKKNISLDYVTLKLTSDLFYHEIGHRGGRNVPGCPRTFELYSSSFIDPLSEVTQIQDKQVLGYFANCLTDLINNTNIKKFNQEGLTSLTGCYLFFKEQGKKTDNSSFNKLYEAHVRLNLFFNGDKFDANLLREYFTFDQEINQAIQNFLSRTGISEMKTDVLQGTKIISVKNQEKIRKYLINEDNWITIARIYGEEFGKFIEQKPTESLQGAGGSLDNPSESSDKPSGESTFGGEGSDTNEKEFNPSDGFGSELNDKHNQKRLIANGRKAGTMPGWMTNFEYLLGLYELLAEDKIFELVPPRSRSKTYPLVDLSERTFDFDEDSARDIIGVQFDKHSKTLELKVGKFKYNIPTKVRMDVNNRPDLIFGLLDTSGSMKEAMPQGNRLGEVVNPKASVRQQWRYNSKYHVGLITYFMAVQRFEDLGINESDAFFANFSYSTIVSQGLRNSLKEALHPQFGGTSIDLNKIEHLLDRPGNFIFTISDGEISNAGALLQKMEGVAEDNPYFHVQIGGHSVYSEGLKAKGLFVKQVKEEKELYNFMIDLTDKLYGVQK